MEAVRLINASSSGRFSAKLSMIEVEEANEKRAEHDEVLHFVDLLGNTAALKSLKETYYKVRTTTTIS